MICPNCGESIEHMAEYCKYCGKPTNAAARYNYRPPVVPIRGVETKPEGTTVMVDTSLRDAFDRLADYVRNLPTKKQMKATMFRYAVILAAFTLLCTAFCAIGIAKNRAEIAKLEKLSSLMATTQTDATDQKSAVSTPTTSAESTPAITTASAVIHFDLNLPKAADTAKFPPTPKDITPSKGEDVHLPLFQDTETFRFLGWNTRQDGKGGQYSANAVFDMELSGDLTLFAQWELIEKN